MSNFCDAATGKASKQKRDIYFVNCSSCGGGGFMFDTGIIGVRDITIGS